MVARDLKIICHGAPFSHGFPSEPKLIQNGQDGGLSFLGFMSHSTRMTRHDEIMSKMFQQLFVISNFK